MLFNSQIRRLEVVEMVVVVAEPSRSGYVPIEVPPTYGHCDGAPEEVLPTIPGTYSY